jgi:DNA-binding transcriptional ArsR family regulator
MSISVYIGLVARAATTTDIFNALGDATRRDILDLLAVGEAGVGDLVERLGMPQPQVSKHLKVLRDVDAVRTRSVGRHRMYRVHQPALAPLQTWLDRLTAAVNAHYDRMDDYIDTLQRHAND